MWKQMCSPVLAHHLWQAVTLYYEKAGVRARANCQKAEKAKIFYSGETRGLLQHLMSCWVQRGLAEIELKAGCREAVTCRNLAEGGIENCLQHAVAGYWHIPLFMERN